MSGERALVPPLRYRALVRLLAPPLVAHLLLRASRDGGWRYVTERLGFGDAARLVGRSSPADEAAGRAGRPATGEPVRWTAEGDRASRHRGPTSGSEGDERTARSPPEATRPWVHAASVGEVLTVLPLLEAMLARPDTGSVLVTTNTPTGADVLARRAPEGIRHRYLPIDWPGATRRFLERERPTSARIVETEIWPWLYAGCRSRGVPLAIVNARLSPRTLRHADGPLGPVYRRALDGVDVLARSDADARGYLALGAATGRVRRVGDLKFASGASAVGTPAALLARPYVLAASTHADEERRLAEAWLRTRTHGLLVIAPRHPERGAALARELPGCGRRSLGEAPAADARLHLADTLGELDGWYAHAAGVFVGGSLIERGGHNVLEPARHGRAIVVGPHTANFTDAVAALRAAAAIETARDAEAVARFLARALDGDDTLARQGARAREVSADTADVVARYLAALDDAGTPMSRDTDAPDLA